MEPPSDRLAEIVNVEFAELAWVQRGELVQAVRALAQLREATRDERTLVRLELLLRRVAGLEAPLGTRSERVGVAKDVVLDLAADLLGEAVELHSKGADAAAFAIEGIEGRLLEALVGAGSLRCGL